MFKIAVYGKGGIGKSTTLCNIAVALARRGLKVLQVGCDPKADSTSALHGGRPVPTVLQLMRTKGEALELSDMVHEGHAGVLCVEAGGPVPGLGCAGRGIIAALEKLEQKGVYREYHLDAVLYDVLGDVVCGGFSMPMRRGYAEKVYIVSSGENMSIHAAANIAMAIDNFRGRGYASLGGIILNRRNVPGELEKVQELCSDFRTRIVGTLDWSSVVQQAESMRMTVMEAFPESDMARQYASLADSILEDCKGVPGA